MATDTHISGMDMDILATGTVTSTFGTDIAEGGTTLGTAGASIGIGGTVTGGAVAAAIGTASKLDTGLAIAVFSHGNSVIRKYRTAIPGASAIGTPWFRCYVLNFAT